MATAVDIGRAGEGVVVQWLRQKNYTKILWDTKGAGATDIEASGSTGLLIQVKSAVAPSSPASLSAEEEAAIKARAGRKGYQAWEAQVQLDQDLSPLGEIKWRKLR